MPDQVQRRSRDGIKENLMSFGFYRVAMFGVCTEEKYLSKDVYYVLALVFLN